ncbi:hypothetical protein COTS27_00188 [Spirochaetota bacterium]|nr:hypothetical protein COTS27_00188 [Spirochaetota bacterium]
MDRSTVDRAGALLYKLVKELPAEVTQAELQNFKNILDEENLTTLVDLDHKRYLQKIAALKKREESFKEKIELSKQAIEASKNYGDTEEKKERRSRITKLIKKATDRKSSVDPNKNDDKKPEPPQQKSTLDLEKLSRERRTKVSSDLEKKILEQQKTPPPSQSSPTTKKTTTTQFNIPEDLSTPLPTPSTLLASDNNSSTTTGIPTSAASSPQPSPPHTKEKPSSPKPAATSNFAKINTGNLELFPTIEGHELDANNMQALKKKSAAILDTFPENVIDIDSPSTPKSATAPPPNPNLQAIAKEPPSHDDKPSLPSIEQPPAPLPETTSITTPKTTPQEEENAITEPQPTPVTPKADLEEQIPQIEEEFSTQASPSHPKQHPPSEIKPSTATQTNDLPLLDDNVGISGIENLFDDKIDSQQVAAASSEPLQAENKTTSSPHQPLPTTEAKTDKDELDASSTPPASKPPKKIITSLAESNIDLKNLDFETPSLKENLDPPPTQERQVEPEPFTKPTASSEIKPDQPIADAPTRVGSDIDYDRAFHIIRGFKAENRNIILNALTQNNTVTHAEADDIARRVLADEDPSRIANFVRNLIFQKTYQETATKPSHKEIKLVDELYKKEKAATFAKRMVLVLLLAFFGFFIYRYGIDYIHSTILYERAYSQANKNNFIVSENYFRRALGIRHSTRAIHRLGTLYHYKKRNLEAAEQKYIIALRGNPTDKKTLLSYTGLLIDGKQFPEASEKIDFLKATFSTSDKNVREVDGEYHIAWGRQEVEPTARAKRLNRAKFIFSELSSERSRLTRKLFYMARLLEASSLNNDFIEARDLYVNINNRRSQYIEPRAFTTYIDFLATTYKNDNSRIDPVSESSIALTEKNNTIVTHIEHIQRKLYEGAASYLPFYYSMGNWNLITDDLERALEWSGEGVDLYEKTGSPFEFEPSILYSLNGELKYRLGDYTAAKTTLTQALDLYSGEPTANYYLGKIYLTSEQRFDNAETYFLKALANLTYYARPLAETTDEYRDLVYSLGYTYYGLSKHLGVHLGETGAALSYTEPSTVTDNNSSKQTTSYLSPSTPPPPNPPSQLAETLADNVLGTTVIAEPDLGPELTRRVLIADREEKLQKALTYWNQLLADPRITKRYVLDYAIANAYLLLGRYQLAEAKIEQGITELIASYNHYTEANGKVTDPVITEVSILSDLYNNLGIVKAEQRAQQRDNPYLLKQAALENFINAITIKDKLSLLRGHSYANFNTLNYENKEQRGFLLTDEYMPSELIQ